MNKTIVKNDYDNKYTSNEYFLNNFKNTIKRMVLTKRKEAGFIDDYNKEYNDKLLARMKEILDDSKIDESRILTEAAIYADKIAVAEETVRLRSRGGGSGWPR